MCTYVDAIFSVPKTDRWPYGFACHLFGSDHNELHDLAFKLGLHTRWFVNDPHHAYYPITPGKRKQALSNGAIELTDEQAKNFWDFGSPTFVVQDGN